MVFSSVQPHMEALILGQYKKSQVKQNQLIIYYINCKLCFPISITPTSSKNSPKGIQIYVGLIQKKKLEQRFYLSILRDFSLHTHTLPIHMNSYIFTDPDFLFFFIIYKCDTQKRCRLLSSNNIIPNAVIHVLTAKYLPGLLQRD